MTGIEVEMWLGKLNVSAEGLHREIYLGGFSLAPGFSRG